MDYKLIYILLYLLIGILHAEHKKTYKGFKVLNIQAKDSEEWEQIQTILGEVSSQVDTWREPHWGDGDISADVMMSTNDVSHLAATFQPLGIKHHVLIDDVQTLIEKSETPKEANDENVLRRFRRAPANISNEIIGKYATYEQIKAYLSGVAQYFSDVVKVKKIGETYFGEPLLVIKIGIPSAKPKPAIWIDSGLHSREWVAHSSVMYAIYQFLSGYYIKDPDIMTFLKEVDWYMMPVGNPDGYIFTHTEERLWRKNRARNPDSTCRGTDLNRNWAFHWGNLTASNKPCDILYRGAHAASELETQAISSYILHHHAALMAYVSVHSYGQCWLSRYSYTKEKPPDHEELLKVAIKMSEAASDSSGTEYKAGRSHEYLYSYSGGSADWARGVAGIKYSYTVELRDRGKHGFMLPAKYIIPVGKEFWEGIRVLAYHIVNTTTLNISENESDIGEDFEYHAPTPATVTEDPTPRVIYRCPPSSASYTQLPSLISYSLMIACLYTCTSTPILL